MNNKDRFSKDPRYSFYNKPNVLIEILDNFY